MRERNRCDRSRTSSLKSTLPSAVNWKVSLPDSAHCSTRTSRIGSDRSRIRSRQKASALSSRARISSNIRMSSGRATRTALGMQEMEQVRRARVVAWTTSPRSFPRSPSTTT